MSRFHTDPWVNIVDPGDETVEVRKMNWRSFRTLVFRENKALSLDLMDKMCYLLSFCTVLNEENHIYGLWIELNQNEAINNKNNNDNNNNNNNNNDIKSIKLKLIISLSHYMSNTTLESTLQRTMSGQNERIYFLIQIFEDNTFHKGPLLTLRLDRFGEYGELVWLQKGKLLSGQTMLNFCIEFIDYFQITSCYLMDSSQINLVNIPFSTRDGRKYDLKKKYKYKCNDNKSKKKGHLRLLHILSSYNIEDNNFGKTWYEEHADFKAINIKNWPLIPRLDRNIKQREKFETITQDINCYKNAIHFIRNFKLNEIIKYLNNEQKMHLNAMISYYKQYTFDYDTKLRISKEAEKYKYECKQTIYSQSITPDNTPKPHSFLNERGRKKNRFYINDNRERSISSNSSRSRSRSRDRNDNNFGWKKRENRDIIIINDDDDDDDDTDSDDDDIKMNNLRNLKIGTNLPLITVHDLCRRVHCCSFYGPTKWRKLLGLRHLRILYDILIDPMLATKTKNNGFLKYEEGRKYLQSLSEIMNFRVFCKGIHKNDRIDGIIKTKQITKYQINKFMMDLNETINIYKTERDENREKYKMYIDGDIDEDIDDENDNENETNFRLSLNFKNNNNNYSNSYKHEISIDSTDNNHEIKISVKSSKKRRKYISKKQRRRSRRLSNLKKSGNKSSGDDI